MHGISGREPTVPAGAEFPAVRGSWEQPSAKIASALSASQEQTCRRFLFFFTFLFHTKVFS
jgi:hypothetical protein